jgi:hypothetical protein
MRYTLKDEVAVVELSDRDVVQRDRIIGSIGDHHIPMTVVMGGGQRGCAVCEFGVAKLDRIRPGRVIGVASLCKLRREHKSVVVSIADQG